MKPQVGFEPTACRSFCDYAYEAAAKPDYASAA